MPGPTLYNVFEYLAALIAERRPDEPFLLTQIQPALLYKFPNFNFADYQLNGVRDFLAAGEKAGYFKFVNMGSPQTSYLAPGPKASAPPPPADTEMGAHDPRRTQWMTLAMEDMLTAERGDQIVDAMRHIDALSPEFDAFLATEGKTAPLYPVRGKIRRLREFLKTYREKGEAQAIASWQVSRMMLRMPTIPQVQTAAAAQSLVWALLQGNKQLKDVPIQSLDNMFFAVIAFSREQMVRNKSWDWAIGLDMLEAEARAMPRPAPPIAKRTLLGTKSKPATDPYALDDNEIKALYQLLRQTAGIRATMIDDVPIWEAFVNTPSLDQSFRFLSEQPRLLENEKLLNWLENAIGKNVAAGNMDVVKNLANKAALVVGARQMGLQQIRQQPGELKAIYESVLEGAQLLRILFGFLDAPTPSDAAAFYKQHNELSDEEVIGQLLDDQTVQAVHDGDVSRYRRVTERADLWRNLIEFGADEGMRQHERFINSGRDDKTIQAEMGITLLVETKTPEDRQDVIGRYPAVATDTGLGIITHILDALSFQNTPTEEYNRYFEVKRLIERCLQVGVDRALSELK